MRLNKRYRRKWWTGTLPLVIFTAACLCIMQSQGITKNTILDAAASAVQENLGYQAVLSCMPVLVYDASDSGQKSIYEYLAANMDELLPIYGYVRDEEIQTAMGSMGVPGETGDSCGNFMDAVSSELLIQENRQAAQEQLDVQGSGGTDSAEPSAAAAGEKVRKFSRQKLNDFDYLLQNFYVVDRTTTINSGQLNAEELLGKSMKLNHGPDAPQILIYHTHSQEGFADSTGDASTSIVGVGEYLNQLLGSYGFHVIHHTGEYDVETRDNAYSKAGPAVEQILRENPSIEIVIDLHRDGVPEGTRLVTEQGGKEMASIMFFNGLSRTTANGDIGYLPNPYIQDNLAFSLQMQLAAKEYYPGFSRAIYLKGYRYNMHYCPKTLLVEVGAQTNTVQEAMNAMEPLADIIAKVISPGE